jgi:hypothetical protein
VSRAYPTARNGVWIQPIRRGYKMSCCDCGLVHVMDFRIASGHVQFRPARDNRATGQVRRQRGIRVTRS